MSGDFEDHCWKDLIPPEIFDVYAPYRRKTFVGPSPALVAIDLYEMAYQGGPHPVAQLTGKYPSACGEFAWAAIEPTKRLFDAARRAGLPVFYSTGDARADARPDRIAATKRIGQRTSELYTIRPEFKPQPGDVVIHKQRASAFFG